MFFGIRKYIFVFLCLFFSAASVSAQSAGSLSFPKPRFDLPLEQASSSGHIKLIWAPETELPQSGFDYQLQKSSAADFNQNTIIYTGDDLATYMSGLADGTYYFRLRHVEEKTTAPASPWSDTLILNVEHHSLTMALWLFVLGFFVFGAIVIVLLKGIKDVKA